MKVCENGVSICYLFGFLLLFLIGYSVTLDGITLCSLFKFQHDVGQVWASHMQQ